MSNFDIIRAWKDTDYRESLTSEEQAQLPENPAGLIELADTELSIIEGGNNSAAVWSWGCCPGFTTNCTSIACSSTNCPVTNNAWCYAP